MPESTLDLWLRADGQCEPLVHSVSPARRGWPRVPFGGLIEAFVLRTLREAGYPMDEIRRIAALTRAEFDDPFALATQRIASDGVNLFLQARDGRLVNQHGQGALRQVLDSHLQFIRWDEEGKPRQLRLSQYPASAQVIIDPRFAWGRPVIEASKVPISAVVELWHAGESMDLVAEEFDLSRDVVEDILRLAASVLRRPEPGKGDGRQAQGGGLEAAPAVRRLPERRLGCGG